MEDCRQSTGDKGFNTVEFLLCVIFIESEPFNEKKWTKPLFWPVIIFQFLHSKCTKVSEKISFAWPSVVTIVAVAVCWGI